MEAAPKPTPLADQFSSSEMNWFHAWLTYLDGKLTAIKKEEHEMALNVAALQAAVTKLQTDVTTLTGAIGGLVTKVNQAAADEAAAQAAVDGATTAITNLDATVVAAIPPA